jgi:hypothetical protein
MQFFDLSLTRLALCLGLATALCLSGCVHLYEAGDLTIVSTRNFETTKSYKRLKSYAGVGKKEARRSKATSIDQAVDETLRSVPGGEYLTNANVYVLSKGKKAYYHVTGDVWGLETDEPAELRGFRVGDKVSWRANGQGNRVEGTILSLTVGDKKQTGKKCLVRLTNGESLEVNYDWLTKIVE